MKRASSLFVTAAVALSLLATVLSGCSKSERGEEAKKEERKPEASDRVVLKAEALQTLRLAHAKAQERELSPSLELPAELVPNPDRQATVGPRVAGRVARVRVNVGDRVKRGTGLLVLESREVGRARAELLAARARVAVTRLAAKRSRRLAQDRIVPQRQVEEAEGALRLAQAALQGARTRLSTFGVSLKRPSRRNPARVVLTSPISGTVVARSVYVGQWVKPSDSLFEVVNLDELWLMVFVYERELRYVKRGQAVRVGVRAYPGEVFRGTVRLVGNTLDKRTRSVAVRVVLPNRKHRLKPGMFATARIVGTHAHAPRKMLAVPWTAVQVMDGRRSVFVRVSKGVFALRKIRTGERVGKFVEVLKGLSKGDEVVTDGSFLLKGELLKSTLAEED